MDVGKLCRLNRLFSHPSGRLCSVAIDHFIGYQTGLPEGLRDLSEALRLLMAGGPDAVTMHKGTARALWGSYAGRVPLIVQSCIVRADDAANDDVAVPEEAVRLGADAIACVAFTRGATEASYLRRVADVVRQAEPWNMPVVLHIYPRTFSDTRDPEISFDPEDVAWSVRCGIELGADVIKVPYTGDAASYGQIVRACPVKLVAAGGPKADTVRAALEMASGVIAGGAMGMTIGRNIWGAPDPSKTLEAFKAVIHDDLPAEKALEAAGMA